MVIGAVLGAVVLGGCGGGSGSAAGAGAGAGSGTADDRTSTAGAPPSASASASATASAPAAEPTADQRLVTVTRSGGFAGKQISLLVKADGSWTRLDGKAQKTGSGRLSAAELDALRGALKAADFPRLPRTVLSEKPVYDGFTYAFVHGGYEVAADGAVMPAGLTKVLQSLPPFDAA
ncbi:hypothetical protein [Streptomyces antimicrobicus]|uniref:Lipoprotein n=1 Tax=Streptomyces antimicrobicus TaxID=2883108 RepID=A0ABS8B6Y1_9ACTN|nr:hypothetical protein [Streptomyces antimicrobicus]MCB5180380.1 hypothetical protein [Streptomyces antimicrobicus]